jgi:serine protease
MLKNILLISIVVLFNLPVYAHHTLEEAITMFKQNHVQKKLVTVKFKEVSSALPFERVMVVNHAGFKLKTGIPTKAEPVFISTKNNIFGKTVNSTLNNYYYFHLTEVPTEDQALEILNYLYADPTVEYAFFEPVTEDAVMPTTFMALKAQVAVDQVTPDLKDKQFYLKASPVGVNAEYAWTIPGGTGKGVKIVDVERGWFVDHEDFNPSFYTNGNNMRLDHGTAVWGEIASKNDDKGMTGIAYDVLFGTSGTISTGTVDEYFASAVRAIESAVAQLQAGDVIIIEQQGPGPVGYAPIEYWDPIFTATKLATDKGIYVVAAAANGYNSLDNAAYKGVFDLKVRDSGAVFVGAAAPPDSTEAAHMSRLDFSNYGSRVDAAGYGDGVPTLGYGDLFNGGDSSRTYTKKFSGTSSATPIVAGSVVSMAGMAKASGKHLTPTQLRQALRDTGTKQTGNTAERIGNLPDLAELHRYINQL